MALTSSTTFDIADQTQSITFYESSTQVDQISYSASQITYSAISLYSLSKADFAMYILYLRLFYNLLNLNFPSIVSYLYTAWPNPGTSFSISQTTPPLRIVYNQVSVGTTVQNISYLPVASVATFTARASPVTISCQEWATGFDLMSQFSTQVATN